MALGVGDEVLDYEVGAGFVGGGRMSFGVGSLERNYRPGLFADAGTNLLSSRNFAPAKYPRPPAHAGQIQGRRSAEVADIFRRQGIEAAENSAMTAKGVALAGGVGVVGAVARGVGAAANKNIVIAEFRASEISATSAERRLAVGDGEAGPRAREVADIFRRQGIEAAENSAMTALREGASTRGGLAWVDVYSDNLRPDGKASAGAGNDSGLYESSAARIVCVRPVNSDSYARPGPLGTVSFSAKTRRWLQAAEAPARFTVTAHARRRIRDGSLAGAAEMFSPTVAAPFQVRKLAGDSNDATLAFAVFRSAAVSAGNFDLPIVAPLGFRATFVLSVRARSGALVFDGANLFAGAAVAYDVANALDGRAADVTLRYYGPRRGLHYVHSEVALADGWQEAVCGLDSDWRLPSFGEAAALAGNHLAVVAADAGAVGAGALVNQLAPLPLPRAGDSPPLNLSSGVFGDFYSSSALVGGLHSAVPAASRLVSGADGFVACVREEGGGGSFRSGIQSPTGASPSRAVFLSDDGREVLSGRLAVSSTDSPLLTLEIRGRRYGRSGPFYGSAEGLAADLISDYSAFSASVSHGDNAATMVISGSWPAGYSAQLTVRARPAYGPAADFAAVVGGTETSLDYVAPPPLVFNGTTLTSPGTRITTATEVPHVLEYLGRRRGLHFAAGVESTPRAGEDKLAACAADGWRLPSLTELAGLLRDGTSATLGAFALRGGEKIPGVSARQEIALNAEPDSYAPQASTLSGNAPLALDLQSNLADSSSPEFHRSIFVLPDSLALYSAGRTDANRSARLVCVKVAAENYAGANHFSEVSFEVDGAVATTGAASLVAPRRTDSFYEVEVVSQRPQVRVDGTQDDDVFAELVDSPSGYDLSYADGRVAFQMNPHELDSIETTLTLRAESGPLVRKFSLKVSLLAAAQASGDLLYYPGQATELLQNHFVIHYGGRRRGLHWMYYDWRENLDVGLDLENSKDFGCGVARSNGGGGNAWRVPTAGEVLGLFVDGLDSYVLREDTPAITGLGAGLRILLPPLVGGVSGDGRSASGVASGAPSASRDAGGTGNGRGVWASSNGGFFHRERGRDPRAGEVAICVAEVDAASYVRQPNPMAVRFVSGGDSLFGAGVELPQLIGSPERTGPGGDAFGVVSATAIAGAYSNVYTVAAHPWHWYSFLDSSLVARSALDEVVSVSVPDLPSGLEYRVSPFADSVDGAGPVSVVFYAADADSLAAAGVLRFTILATPELGTVAAFPVEMTIAAEEGSSAGRISYRGEAVRHLGEYASGEVGNVLDGAVRAPTLVYEGQRRGLHILRTRLGDYADGWQENVCATGAREGWRLPTFGEAAGLLSDSDSVSVAIGNAFVKSDAAAYDSAGGEFPLAAAAELLAGVYASVYFADGRGGVVGDDGNGGLSLSDGGVGYVVCVSEVSLLSYEPRKILSGVTLHSAYPAVSAVEGDAPFLTVTLRSYVNHRGGGVNDGAFSATVLGDFAGTFSYSGGGVGEVALSAPSESSSGSATLRAFPAYGAAAEFVVRGLRSAPLAGATFGGSVIASGGEVETTLGVTLRYAGHRRGLHILIGAEVANGLALARDYCATGSDEGWRVPGLAESFGLLIDSDSVAVSRPGLGTLSGVVSGADVLPGWDSLEGGRTVPLPNFDAEYYAASTLAGPIAADAFALHEGRAHAAAVQVDGWSFFGNEKVSPVCVLSDSDSGYVRPPDVRGVGVSLGAFDFPESTERAMTIGLLLTIRAEACRYAYDGSQDCSEIPKFQMSTDAAGLTLVSGGDGRATLLGDSSLLRNARAAATVFAETKLGGGFSRSYAFVRPSLAAEFAGEWLLPGGQAEVDSFGELGGSARVTLEYYGVRRGLRVFQSSADVADGFASSACAAGGGSWRVPKFAEAAGLLASGDAATLSAARGSAVYDGLRTGALIPLAELSPADASTLSASSGVFADYYLRGSGAFHYAPRIGGDGAGNVYADVGNARVACVSAVADGYVVPANPSRVWAERRGTIAADADSPSSSLTLETRLADSGSAATTLRAVRLLRVGMESASDEFQVSLSGDVEISLQVLDSESGRIALLEVSPSLVSSTLYATLTASPGLGEALTLAVEWRRRDLQAAFGSVRFYAAGEAGEVDGVGGTLAYVYHGVRNGLRVVYSRDKYSSSSAGHCETYGKGEWRPPNVSELLGLTAGDSSATILAVSDSAPPGARVGIEFDAPPLSSGELLDGSRNDYGYSALRSSDGEVRILQEGVLKAAPLDYESRVVCVRPVDSESYDAPPWLAGVRAVDADGASRSYLRADVAGQLGAQAELAGFAEAYRGAGVAAPSETISITWRLPLGENNPAGITLLTLPSVDAPGRVSLLVSVSRPLLLARETALDVQATPRLGDSFLFAVAVSRRDLARVDLTFGGQTLTRTGGRATLWDGRAMSYYGRRRGLHVMLQPEVSSDAETVKERACEFGGGGSFRSGIQSPTGADGAEGRWRLAHFSEVGALASAGDGFVLGSLAGVTVAGLRSGLRFATRVNEAGYAPALSGSAVALSLYAAMETGTGYAPAAAVFHPDDFSIRPSESARLLCVLPVSNYESAADLGSPSAAEFRFAGAVASSGEQFLFENDSGVGETFEVEARRWLVGPSGREADVRSVPLTATVFGSGRELKVTIEYSPGRAVVRGQGPDDWRAGEFWVMSVQALATTGLHSLPDFVLTIRSARSARWGGGRFALETGSRFWSRGAAHARDGTLRDVEFEYVGRRRGLLYAVSRTAHPEGWQGSVCAAGGATGSGTLTRTPWRESAWRLPGLGEALGLGGDSGVVPAFAGYAAPGVSGSFVIPLAAGSASDAGAHDAGSVFSDFYVLRSGSRLPLLVPTNALAATETFAPAGSNDSGRIVCVGEASADYARPSNPVRAAWRDSAGLEVDEAEVKVSPNVLTHFAEEKVLETELHGLRLDSVGEVSEVGEVEVRAVSLPVDYEVWVGRPDDDSHLPGFRKITTGDSVRATVGSGGLSPLQLQVWIPGKPTRYESIADAPPPLREWVAAGRTRIRNRGGSTLHDNLRIWDAAVLLYLNGDANPFDNTFVYSNGSSGFLRDAPVRYASEVSRPPAVSNRDHALSILKTGGDLNDNYYLDRRASIPRRTVIELAATPELGAASRLKLTMTIGMPSLAEAGLVANQIPLSAIGDNVLLSGVPDVRGLGAARGIRMELGGRRRGLYFMRSTAAHPDGYQENVCDAMGSEWRLPTLGELLGLAHDGDGSYSAAAGTMPFVPGVSSQVPLVVSPPDEDGFSQGKLAAGEAAFANVYAQDFDAAGNRAVRVVANPPSFAEEDAAASARIVCVQEAEGDYVSQPRLAGAALVLRGFPVRGEMRPRTVATVSVSLWRYNRFGETVVAEEFRMATAEWTGESSSPDAFEERTVWEGGGASVYVSAGEVAALSVFASSPSAFDSASGFGDVTLAVYPKLGAPTRVGLPLYFDSLTRLEGENVYTPQGDFLGRHRGLLVRLGACDNADFPEPLNLTFFDRAKFNKVQAQCIAAGEEEGYAVPGGQVHEQAVGCVLPSARAHAQTGESFSKCFYDYPSGFDASRSSYDRVEFGGSNVREDSGFGGTCRDALAQCAEYEIPDNPFSGCVSASAWRKPSLSEALGLARPDLGDAYVVSGSDSFAPGLYGGMTLRLHSREVGDAVVAALAGAHVSDFANATGALGARAGEPPFGAVLASGNAEYCVRETSGYVRGADPVGVLFAGGSFRSGIQSPTGYELTVTVVGEDGVVSAGAVGTVMVSLVRYVLANANATPELKVDADEKLSLSFSAEDWLGVEMEIGEGTGRAVLNLVDPLRAGRATLSAMTPLGLQADLEIFVTVKLLPASSPPSFGGNVFAEVGSSLTVAATDWFGDSATMTFAYHGRRKGLHYAYSDVVAAGHGLLADAAGNVCAANGWRVPRIGEAAGLVVEGDSVLLDFPEGLPGAGDSAWPLAGDEFPQAGVLGGGGSFRSGIQSPTGEVVFVGGIHDGEVVRVDSSGRNIYAEVAVDSNGVVGRLGGAGARVVCVADARRGAVAAARAAGVRWTTPPDAEFALRESGVQWGAEAAFFFRNIVGAEVSVSAGEVPHRVRIVGGGSFRSGIQSPTGAGAGGADSVGGLGLAVSTAVDSAGGLEVFLTRDGPRPERGATITLAIESGGHSFRTGVAALREAAPEFLGLTFTPNRLTQVAVLGRGDSAATLTVAFAGRRAGRRWIRAAEPVSDALAHRLCEADPRWRLPTMREAGGLVGAAGLFRAHPDFIGMEGDLSAGGFTDLPGDFAALTLGVFADVYSEKTGPDGLHRTGAAFPAGNFRATLGLGPALALCGAVSESDPPAEQTAPWGMRLAGATLALNSGAAATDGAVSLAAGGIRVAHPYYVSAYPYAGSALVPAEAEKFFDRMVSLRAAVASRINSDQNEIEYLGGELRERFYRRLDNQNLPLAARLVINFVHRDLFNSNVPYRLTDSTNLDPAVESAVNAHLEGIYDRNKNSYSPPPRYPAEVQSFMDELWGQADRWARTGIITSADSLAVMRAIRLRLHGDRRDWSGLENQLGLNQAVDNALAVLSRTNFNFPPGYTIRFGDTQSERDQFFRWMNLLLYPLYGAEVRAEVKAVRRRRDGGLAENGSAVAAVRTAGDLPGDLTAEVSGGAVVLRLGDAGRMPPGESVARLVLRPDRSGALGAGRTVTAVFALTLLAGQDGFVPPPPPGLDAPGDVLAVLARNARAARSDGTVTLRYRGDYRNLRLALSEGSRDEGLAESACRAAGDGWRQPTLREAFAARHGRERAAGFLALGEIPAGRIAGLGGADFRVALDPPLEFSDAERSPLAGVAGVLSGLFSSERFETLHRLAGLDADGTGVTVAATGRILCVKEIGENHFRTPDPVGVRVFDAERVRTTRSERPKITRQGLHDYYKRHCSTNELINVEVTQDGKSVGMGCYHVSGAKAAIIAFRITPTMIRPGRFSSRLILRQIFPAPCRPAPRPRALRRSATRRRV